MCACVTGCGSRSLSIIHHLLLHSSVHLSQRIHLCIFSSLLPLTVPLGSDCPKLLLLLYHPLALLFPSYTLCTYPASFPLHPSSHPQFNFFCPVIPCCLPPHFFPDSSLVRLSFWGLVNKTSQPKKKTNWPIEVFWVLIPPPPFWFPHPLSTALFCT